MILVDYLIRMHRAWGKLFDWWFSPQWFNRGLLPLFVVMLAVFGWWVWHYRRILRRDGVYGAVYLGNERTPVVVILVLDQLGVVIAVAGWPLLLWALMYGVALLGPFVLTYYGVMYFVKREERFEKIIGTLEGR